MTYLTPTRANRPVTLIVRVVEIKSYASPTLEDSWADIGFDFYLLTIAVAFLI